MGNLKIELDLYNCATKADSKNGAGANTTNFSKKSDLASLKSEMYKLVIAKLENTPVDLRKLNDAVKNQVVENTLNNESVKKPMLFRLLILVI